METTVTPPLSLPILLLNLAIGIGLSLIVSWYYVKFGNSLSNRSKFAPILPMLTLITLLTITIVKSSLALSLGLVGALSIVRFRTAIKDPEELIFLFFAIAIGLGLGADQRIPTVASVTVILAYLLIRSLIGRKRKGSHSLFLNIQLNSNGNDSGVFTSVNQMLVDQLHELDLRRLDQANGRLQLTYYVNIKDQSLLVGVMDTLKNTYPDSSISLIEQNNLLGG